MANTFRSRLVGAWTLESQLSINPADPNDVVHPMGEDCKGQIIYTGDGYVSAQLQWNNFKTWTQGFAHATAEELAAMTKRGFAYCGTFYLELVPGNKQTIYHHISLCQPPERVEGFQPRLAELTEGEDGVLRLTLQTIRLREEFGAKRYLKLVWKKLPENQRTVPPPAPATANADH